VSPPDATDPTAHPGDADPIAAARRLGIEADEDAARTWMVAVESGAPGAVGTDATLGVFGDRIALLDFDPEDLGRLRRLVPHVRVVAHSAVESAIAISGSSAQGRVQLFPGDADFFERVHIHAGTEAEAQQTLRDVMRATALRAFEEPDIVLVEVNLGVYDEAVVERGRAHEAGDPITWTPDDVVAGEITVDAATGGARTFAWDDAVVGGGWVYLGWIVADREEGRIALASVMIDPTWEDPSGTIRSLDGAVDPLAQEIYLEPEALTLVERVDDLVASDARDTYRAAMRGEAYHYTHVDPNFAKAAKRLYNLFRVADELEAAAYVRELFDEPTAKLYQVPGLLEAADVALDPESGIDRETVLRQLDLVATAIADVTDGAEEADLLAQLARLREAALREGRDGESWAAVLADVRTRSAAIVNEFFRTRLLAYERVRDLVEGLASEGAG
jgi:hypothetical protein